jgi:branched-chain amino acid transport system substrate-binding protein
MALRKFAMLAVGMAGAALLAVAGARADSTGVSDTEIRIGAIGPLSGPVYMWGKLAMNGVEAVFAEANAAGGIHGRKLVLVREDDDCKPERAIGAVKKLAYEHKVFAIIGGACSNATLAIRPELEAAKIPMVVNSAVADGITNPVAANIFTTQLTASVESRAQLQFAVDRGAKNIAVVAQRDAWGMARYTPLMEAFKARGITPVADEEIQAEPNDATAQILRIKGKGADSIILVTYPKAGAILVRDSLKLGFKPLWVGQTAINDMDVFQKQVGMAGALDNFFTITATRYQPTDPEMAEWSKRIKALFPGDDLSVFNLNGIGSAQVMVEALKKAGKTLTRESFQQAMGGIKNFKTDVYPGPISCNAPVSHQCNQSPAWIAVKDGKPTVIGVTTLN